MTSMLNFSISLLLLIPACGINSDSSETLIWLPASIAKMEKELTNKYGEEVLPRIQKGLKQVSEYWRKEDGDSKIFESFVCTHFAGNQDRLDSIFFRFQDHMEKIYGHFDRIVLDIREQADLDRGPLLPIDEIFAAYAPGAHIIDDFFENKLAFIALLNFPLRTLEEKSTEGMKWSRRQWAESRLSAIFSQRVPAKISLEIARISSESEQYIADYNIWMHHLIDSSGQRLFPPKLRLLTHWNLRDELKAQYPNGVEGFSRQRMIQKVMERIVEQSIPQIVINNPAIDWNPYSNEVAATTVKDAEYSDSVYTKISDHQEPNTRYLMLQKNFFAHKKADPYWPTMPNFIQRQFDQSREIPEERITQIFKRILSSETFGEVADLIEKRLNRDLEPFDIWYNGFRPRSKYTEEDLNQIVANKYPTASAFKSDIPRILRKMGFSSQRSTEIAQLIDVDPARGSGHAWGAQMRGAKAHLRTRIGSDGMDYKGYNIAIHELGHNVEQVISLNNIDYTLLNGVPNNAFTEALAFVFQARDLELLGLVETDGKNEALKIINDFWVTCEIAAVALVDIAIWHWMYEHPQVSAADLKNATLNICKDIWNTYFAPVFGKRDIILLGIYSHMISYPLYLADYPLGHIIAYQIEEHMKNHDRLGEEFDRIARLGNIAPDMWMLEATGSKIGSEAILNATKVALKNLEH